MTVPLPHSGFQVTVNYIPAKCKLICSPGHHQVSCDGVVDALPTRNVENECPVGMFDLRVAGQNFCQLGWKVVLKNLDNISKR